MFTSVGFKEKKSKNMPQYRKLRIKMKMILLIVPLLICGFAVNGYMTVQTTRSSLFDQASRFLRYKMSQFESYAASQWQNLEHSGFSGDPVYAAIVRRSLGNYARGMSEKNTEHILALDRTGTLLFFTNEEESEDSVSVRIQEMKFFRNEGIYKYLIGGERYYGLKASLDSPDWEVYVLEEADSFTSEIRRITLQQSLNFTVILIIVLAAVNLLLNSITAPINRFRNTIRGIIEFKDFSRRVDIEFPDEIGDLAFDFNRMTSNFDLAYRRLKEYALNEALAKKEIRLREYETLDVLARASDYKDPETAAHISRVGKYALLLARLIGLDGEQQKLILYASPLHDVGKLGIPDSILLKQGSLTEKEREIMHAHTTIGYKIMQNPSSKYLKAGAMIAISHHERYDGSGYPEGLKGEEIPLFGRIVSLVDVFDALSTNRPYKKAWSFEESCRQIRADRGTLFDPRLVDVFMENLSEVEKIYKEG